MFQQQVLFLLKVFVGLLEQTEGMQLYFRYLSQNFTLQLLTLQLPDRLDSLNQVVSPDLEHFKPFKLRNLVL